MKNITQSMTALIPAVFSSTALFLMTQYKSRMVFFIVLPVWILLIIFIEWRARRINKKQDSLLPIILTTIFSFIGLVSIVEWSFLEPFFILLLGFVILLLFLSLFNEDSFLQIEQKPYRRIMVTVWSFDAFAIITTIFALSLFFQFIPFWILTIVGGGVFFGISIMIWKMYFKLARQQWLSWAFLIALLMVELLWVMHFLPFGYLVSGFLLTWIWYILQLLTRFHFTAHGIIWKKQIWFLGTNLFIFILLVLFFVRWV